MHSVSIMLATYNGGRYLEEQLQSLLGQENVCISVLARDDGSTDDTVSILERWKEQSNDRFSLEYYTGNGLGAAGSFLDIVSKVGLDTEYYAYCDQDDYWMPDKLIKAINLLEEYADVPALYYGDTTRVGSNLEDIENPFGKRYHTENFPGVMISTAASGLTMVMNRRLIELLKSYQPCDIYMHDQWTIQVCAAVGGRVIYDENSYVLYRQHSSNVVGGSSKLQYRGLRLLMYRLKKLFIYKEHPAQSAAEILNGYDRYLSEESKDELVVLRDNRKLANRLRLLFSPVFRTGYRVIDIRFVLQTLLGQL